MNTLQSRPQRKLASMMTRLNEDTTSSDIAFLPSGFKSARSELRKIGKYKSQWHVTMLESTDGVEFRFEDRMKLKTLKEHTDGFCQDVLKTSSAGFPKLVSIRHVIDEAKEETISERRKELDKLIPESVGVKEVTASVESFRRIFGGALVPVAGKKVAIDLIERDTGTRRLVESVHGTLLTRGKVEMLWHAINGGDRSGLAPQHERLSGASVAANCYGHKMLYTVMYGKDGRLTESLKVDGDSSALDEARLRNVRHFEGVIKPVRGSFTLCEFLEIKKALKESDEFEAVRG